MADKKPDDKEKKPGAPATDAATASPAKKKGGIKVIGVVAVLMIVEGAGLFFALKGGPAKTEAGEVHPNLENDPANEKEEVLIVEDQFQNLQTGSVWIWDVSVYAEVKAKNSEKLTELLKRRSAAVREGIGQIFSRAQHAQLKEPEHLTLNRQITAFMGKLIAEEAPTAEAGEEDKLIDRILIPKCRGFPAN
jgi:flagellar basal body-associated protein FliL